MQKTSSFSLMALLSRGVSQLTVAKMAAEKDISNAL